MLVQEIEAGFAGLYPVLDMEFGFGGIEPVGSGRIENIKIRENAFGRHAP